MNSTYVVAQHLCALTAKGNCLRVLARYCFNIHYAMSTSLVHGDNLAVRDYIESILKRIAPPLNSDKHKGQAGKIAIIGGSFEYTGAPYFAAISALKVGVDLVHVICSEHSAPVIKSCSPELIVHGLLDVADALSQIEPWIKGMDAVVVGPGLGRQPATLHQVERILTICRTYEKPLVLDADALFLLFQKPYILENYGAPVVLTPNRVEFERLVGGVSTAGSGGGGRNGTPHGAGGSSVSCTPAAEHQHTSESCDSAPGTGDLILSSCRDRARNILQLAPQRITIVCKGHRDDVFDANVGVTVEGGGSGRRCGGQGDVLAGSLATFLTWSLKEEGLRRLEESSTAATGIVPSHLTPSVIASYAACKLAKLCNGRAFQKCGRSMTASDMIEEIPAVFREYFENADKACEPIHHETNVE